MNRLHFAMIGTRGVPAAYGGFETAIEEVGSRLVQRGHRVTVYCRYQGQTLNEHKGMELVNLRAVRKRSLETLSHTAVSVLHMMRHPPDAAVLFNAGNAPFIPWLASRGVPTAVHMDGLEWQRAKWSGMGAKYYKRAERKAAKSGMALIADARGISDYLWETYREPSHLIAYGTEVLAPGDDKLAQLELDTGGYHLVVARMEPENHVAEIVAGYRMSASEAPLVVVGSAPYGVEYVAHVKQLAGASDTRFVGGVWDQDLLNQLYANARSYLHGHSVGGTNPSLLRALGCAAPVTAFDVNFNREVTAGFARFFTSPEQAAEAISADDADISSASLRGKQGQAHAEATYSWDDVTDKYETLLAELAFSRRAGTRTVSATAEVAVPARDLNEAGKRGR